MADMQLSTCGVSSLTNLCVSQLIAARSLLGDLGDVPLHLLEPVLCQCSAQQLAAIEDETSAGGRDISVELDAYWQRQVTERFAQPNAIDCAGGVDRPQSSSGQRDLQNAAQEASSGCYWRTVYDTRVREHTEKQQRVRDKVQRMFHAEKAARQQRSAQVIETQPPRHHKGRRAAQRCGVHAAAAPSIRQSILKRLALLPGRPTVRAVQKRSGAHGSGRPQVGRMRT